MGGQIGFVSRSGSDFVAITRDTSTYNTLSISSDGKTLATVQQKITNEPYLLAASATEAQPQPLSGDVRDLLALNWTADGKLLASDGARVWTFGRDGSAPVQLISDSNAVITSPCACGNRYIVFAWRFHQGSNSAQIWRANVDGTNAVRLTNGTRDLLPVCSLDAKWVYYFDNTRQGEIWRVPVDASGKPEAVRASTQFNGFVLGSSPAAISADGKTIAYGVELIDPKTQAAAEKIALVNPDADSAPKLLAADPRITAIVQFTPDGKAVAYSIRENGVDNIWVQPLDGSAGHQATHFTSEQIDSFYWSPDAKSLALLRGHSESDVILLQESKH